MATLRAKLYSQEERLREVDGESKAHSASNKLLKEELNSRLVYGSKHSQGCMVVSVCSLRSKENVQECSLAMKELEQQLEEVNRYTLAIELLWG